MKSVVRLACIVVALSTTACQTVYKLTPSGKQTTIAKTFTATPEIDWSVYKNGNAESWTVDGMVLDALLFYTQIEDGKPYDSQSARRSDTPFPVYRSTMSTLEIAELIKDTHTRLGSQHFETTSLTPADLAGDKGFRMDFTFQTKDGLDKRGFAIGAIVDEKLNLAIYTGAQAYYYKQYEGAVEKMLSALERVEEKT